MILKELFGQGQERHNERVWRDTAGNIKQKRIWVRTRAGKKHGPFADDSKANVFLQGRKDLGPGAHISYEP